MRIQEPAQKPYKEMILPLINVVFLLLIFLMVMGQMAERAPFEISPAKSAQGETSQAPLRVFVSADGEMSFAGAKGKAQVLERLQKLKAQTGQIARPVLFRADSGADLRAVLQMAKDVQGIVKTSIKLEVLQR